eukprot:CAMPEP_0204823440 /NCGR_PEP_ID=MMETSP1346-20131115/1498_1 /ASSEMBLY_ACC=CAM_ASM_000771 /TAXON_ID=215587 /ORGANISM="Aplanochytrium stocchinoi, Strain GSBS06" /LENGTH=377 /DNA_ID=CAMNT_0051950077 /DNA_START=383 /DNA_END=1516 /DNA_ORIENTATION=+
MSWGSKPVTWFGLIACLYIIHSLSGLSHPPASHIVASASLAEKDELRISQVANDMSLLESRSKSDSVAVSEEKSPEYNTFHCEVIRRSHLYSKECGNEGTEGSRRRLLITGTGRSGTDFVHTLLTKLGLELSHDVRGPAKDGGVSWPEAFNEALCNHPHWNWKSKVGGGSNKGKFVTFKHVFHLVRHPLKQILSRANNGEWVTSENRRVTACNTVSDEGLNQTETKLNRAIMLTMRHWVLYNSFIEEYAEWRFRLEQLNEERDYIIEQIFTRADWETPHTNTTENAKVSTHKNGGHTKKPKGLALTWDMLFKLDPKYTELCQAMALKYGYEMDEEEILPNVRQTCPDGSVLTSGVDCWFRKKDGKWECMLSKPLCEP